MVTRLWCVQHLHQRRSVQAASHLVVDVCAWVETSDNRYSIWNNDIFRLLLQLFNNELFQLLKTVPNDQLCPTYIGVCVTDVHLNTMAEHCDRKRVVPFQSKCLHRQNSNHPNHPITGDVTYFTAIHLSFILHKMDFAGQYPLKTGCFCPETHLFHTHKRWEINEKQPEETALYRMEVVDSTLKVTHEAVHISYGSIGGSVLRD